MIKEIVGVTVPFAIAGVSFAGGMALSNNMKDDNYAIVLAEKEDDMNALSSSLSSLNDEIANRDLQIENLTTSKNALQKQYDELLSSSGEDKQTIQRLNGEISNLQEQIKTAGEDKEALQNQLNSKLGELSTLQEQVQEKETKIGELNKNISSLTEQVENYTIQVQTLQSKYESVKSQYDTVNQQYQELLKQSEVDKQQIQSLNENISNLKSQISELEEKIQSSQGQENYAIYKKLFEATFSNDLQNFGNKLVMVPDEDGMILLSMATHNARQFAEYNTFKYGVVWGNDCYANLGKTDGSRQLVKISCTDLNVTPIYEKQLDMELYSGFLGTNANGEDCLVVCGLSAEKWIEISKDGTVKEITGPTQGPNPNQPLENYFIENGEEGKTFTYYKDGQFKKSETFSHEIYQYVGGLNPGLIGVGDNEQYTFFNMTNGKMKTITVEEFGAIVTSGNKVLFNDSDKANFLNLDTMTLENNFDGRFVSLRETVESGYSYIVAVLNKNDGSYDMILFKGDGSHEVVKAFGQVGSLSISRCQYEENSFKIYYTIDDGGIEHFDYTLN